MSSRVIVQIGFKHHENFYRLDCLRTEGLERGWLMERSGIASGRAVATFVQHYRPSELFGIPQTASVVAFDQA